MRMFTLIGFLLGSLAIFANANASLTINSDANFTDTEPTDSLSIARGESLFTQHCNNCHVTYISHAYNTDGWNSILQRMSINAGLDSTGSVDLSNYIFNQLSKTDSSNVMRSYGGYRQW